MPQITRSSLMTLEDYAKSRQEFRARVMAHKRNRKIHLGTNVTLIFEDELTMRYQIQEMLRVEKIFEEAGIQEELEAYNPLVPDGTNWKATMMIEYPDPVERVARLAELIGIEDKVWIKVNGFDPIYAIADEDLDRENEKKTASVHFLRFELELEMIKALREGASLSMGIDHSAYKVPGQEVDAAVRNALMDDLTADLAG
ncbi:Protein of unknown function [Nitrosospira multiformis ATCC 25196]|uniref:DUF3501 family protein n=1 Tax=Nitrosospira multiformis (strain ATCC 25196 / NCIMB 11849 / C 71) TaxID=323848 RepID=Q2Y7Y1_NITMU|nr:DUF3501 family protein [Nitrosospira multiformis]ABB75140.1 conserved hypothetical protein [Nitrosospira multiformis ATCC 25196]SEF62123.1 Protein of unknown function [Nitrosospira multiformis ATCC 25196]